MEEKKDIYILGIESSCDDTSAAVLKNGVLLSNVTASQEVHRAYGGVVPELASRAHQQNVVPVVDQAIARAGIKKEDLSAVAFTRGPGLMGSLLVGVSFAKGFARALNIPLIDVNHLQGHVMAHFIKESDDDQSAPPFPFICLLVSGGNSQIVKVNAYNDMEVLGQTIDDAAGEAIDKCAKVLEWATQVALSWISMRARAIRRLIPLPSHTSQVSTIVSRDSRPASSIACASGWQLTLTSWRRTSLTWQPASSIPSWIS